MMEDYGRSLRDGLSQQAAEPKVSALRASIPSAWRSLATAPKGQRILVMCDGKAPWPVMIGWWNGEKWISTDEATSGKVWSVLGWQPLPDPAPIEHQCSFCAKEVAEVRKLIAGPTVFICDECVALCDEILAGDASAMEARRAETGTGSVHDSAVGAAEAPND